jgi:hypothetical protein
MIGLDGNMYIRMKGGNLIPLGQFPDIHPTQKAISEAREVRRKKEEEERKARGYDNDINSMMNEN